MNHHDRSLCVNTLLVQAFGHPLVLFLCGCELKWISFRRVRLFKWWIAQCFQSSADQAKAGDYPMLWEAKRQSVREKCGAGCDSIPDTAWDTCQVEHCRAPPEIRTNIDDKIILPASYLSRNACQ